VRVSGDDNGIPPEQQDASAPQISSQNAGRLLRRFPTDEKTQDWRLLPFYL